MNFKLLAEEIRGLAAGDVDTEIALAGMTDEQVVHHIVTCPCCEEQSVSDDDLHNMVVDATSLNDFIERVNDSQMAYLLTDEELNTVDTIIEAGFHTALDVVIQNRRHIRDGSDAHQKIARQVWTAIRDNVDLMTRRMEADGN